MQKSIMFLTLGHEADPSNLGRRLQGAYGWRSAWAQVAQPVFPRSLSTQTACCTSAWPSLAGRPRYPTPQRKARFGWDPGWDRSLNGTPQELCQAMYAAANQPRKLALGAGTGPATVGYPDAPGIVVDSEASGCDNEGAIPRKSASSFSKRMMMRLPAHARYMGTKLAI